MKKCRTVGVTRYIVTDEFMGDRDRFQSVVPIKLFDKDIIFFYDWVNNRIHVEGAISDDATDYRNVCSKDVPFVKDILLNNDSVIEWMHYDIDKLFDMEGDTCNESGR
jgi:uncharacterized protein YqkB